MHKDLYSTPRQALRILSNTVVTVTMKILKIKGGSQYDDKKILSYNCEYPYRSIVFT